MTEAVKPDVAFRQVYLSARGSEMQQLLQCYARGICRMIVQMLVTGGSGPPRSPHCGASGAPHGCGGAVTDWLADVRLQALYPWECILNTTQDDELRWPLCQEVLCGGGLLPSGQPVGPDCSWAEVLSPLCVNTLPTTHV